MSITGTVTITCTVFTSVRASLAGAISTSVCTWMACAVPTGVGVSIARLGRVLGCGTLLTMVARGATVTVSAVVTVTCNERE